MKANYSKLTLCSPWHMYGLAHTAQRTCNTASFEKSTLHKAMPAKSIPHRESSHRFCRLCIQRKQSSVCPEFSTFLKNLQIANYRDCLLAILTCNRRLVNELINRHGRLLEQRKWHSVAHLVCRFCVMRAHWGSVQPLHPDLPPMYFQQQKIASLPCSL